MAPIADGPAVTLKAIGQASEASTVCLVRAETSSATAHIAQVKSSSSCERRHESETLHCHRGDNRQLWGFDLRTNGHCRQQAAPSWTSQNARASRTESRRRISIARVSAEAHPARERRSKPLLPRLPSSVGKRALRGHRCAEREHQDEIPTAAIANRAEDPLPDGGVACDLGPGYCHPRWPEPELITIHAATATNTRNVREPAREAISVRAAMWALVDLRSDTHATFSAVVRRTHGQRDKEGWRAGVAAHNRVVVTSLSARMHPSVADGVVIVAGAGCSLRYRSAVLRPAVSELLTSDSRALTRSSSGYPVARDPRGPGHQLAADPEDTRPSERDAETVRVRRSGVEHVASAHSVGTAVGRVFSVLTRGHVMSWPGVMGDVRTAVWTIGRAAVAHAAEVALMASAVATLPLQLLRPDGDGAEAQSTSLPAQPHSALVSRPVLLVHGLGGRKSSWSMVARTLSARGLIVDAIAYTPFGTSVEQVADRLVVEVGRILSETGADKVHLVGHSLGGVVIAQAIASGRLDGRVDTVVTLGSPFGGSPWANLLPVGGFVPALRRGSPLLRRLATAPAPGGVRWLAFTATLDMIVPRLRGVPAHAEVETITVRDVGHLGMLSNHQVVGRIAEALPA
jgi:triacylglycerol lipase